ncbi:MAG: hypothetical protein KKD44_17925 [Proteobacteria bacterium]|nr:hypothetical protein [Pseudomonadota bacterium]
MYDEEEGAFETVSALNSDHRFWDDVRLTLSHVYAYGTSESGAIANRSSLRYEFDTTFFKRFSLRLDGRSSLYWKQDHQAGVDDTNALAQNDLRECYIQAGFDAVSFKAGKQVVVWGETDGDVINDVISPRDEREFVFTNLEDARLGQPMVSMDLYSPWGDVFVFVTLDPKVNETPAPGTRYFRGPAGIRVENEKPDTSDQESGIKWKKIFHQFDLSVMAARLRQNTGVLVYDHSDTYKKKYPSYWFYGMGARYATGSLLFTLDASLKRHYQLQTVDISGRYAGSECLMTDNALGVEYDAGGRYTLNAELTHRHIVNDQDDLAGVKQDTDGLFIQYRRLFLNDTLTCQYRFYHQFQEGHTIHNGELDYLFSDHIRVIMDYTFFRERNQRSYYWTYRNDDRISCEIRYYF